MITSQNIKKALQMNFTKTNVFISLSLMFLSLNIISVYRFDHNGKLMFQQTHSPWNAQSKSSRPAVMLLNNGLLVYILNSTTKLRHRTLHRFSIDSNATSTIPNSNRILRAGHIRTQEHIPMLRLPMAALRNRK